jgi:cobalt-zinc-cadmium efflux system protein
MVGWVSVLLAALLIWLEERLTFLDPLLSMVIAIWIFSRVYKPFRATLDIFLQSFPAAISKDALETSLKAFADVDSVHHLHLWSIDENSHVLTAHILVKRALSIPELGKLKKDIKAFLKNNFGILDTTIEIEFPGQECSDPEHSSEF